jgi:anti-sigma regulatory factor (Ser/Thr protein kinase)
MVSGTGAVWAGSGGALPASATELGSSVGAASEPAQQHRSSTGTASTWPRQTHLSLAAHPTAPACARGHVRAVAHEWGLPGVADIAKLLVSELVTNAVRASDRPRIRADLAIVPVIGLWVVSDLISLVIHVWDGNDEMPVLRNSGPDDDSGRGLMLVDTLSKKWGAYRNEVGKTVWVMIGPLNDSQPRASPRAGHNFPWQGW